MTKLKNDLRNAGYKEHISRQNHFDHLTNILFQKCFYRMSDCGEYHLSKKYYLTAYYYDNTIFKREHPNAIQMPAESLQWEAQFTLDTGAVFDVTLGTKGIEEAESFFDELFENMNCADYEEIY